MVYGRHNLKNIVELRQRIRDAFNTIPADMIANATSLMDISIVKCITQRGGGHFEQLL